MIPTWAQISYLIAALCFILALKGLSTPRFARRGNLLAVAGMALATLTAFRTGVVDNEWAILAAIALGTVLAVPAARGVRMTAMPQMVALFNGVGGAAAGLVAITEFTESASHTAGHLLATVGTALIGFVSFTGSLITFGKLQELITTRPVILPMGRVISGTLAVVAVLLALATVIWPNGGLLTGLALTALALGVLFVLPVGGADVPIAISLLNAFTGLSVAASGYVLSNTLLIVSGTLVGAAGTLLTRLMARAMGRPLTNILFGAFTASAAVATGSEQRTVRSASIDDIAIQLNYARSVIIVPGYGLAVAQAQHAVRELADLLAQRGVDVSYGIHPVAGRMPGHMNVLLAESDVNYEQLHEMETVNPRMPSADVALVVGANDVVNPAARSSPESPIYGMPIMDVDKAKSVVFLKRSLRPGFAGVENELLFHERTTLLFGDAKESLTALSVAIKQL